MLVQCPSCNLHYDDSFQVKKCKEGFHGTNGKEKPVEEHVRNTRAARAAHASGGRSKRRKGRQRDAVLPTEAADAPDVSSPQSDTKHAGN